VAQNIYDTPEFFAGYQRLNRSVHGLDGAPEWPAIQAMLPGLTGRRVVDLGCGFGWFARWARGQGAAEILGIDLSENMLARARAETNDEAIRYMQADMEDLVLSEASFDLAYSSLAFHYIADLGRLFGTAHRALAPGAHLVFSIEHPIYMASVRPGWQIADDGRRIWPVDSYAIEGRRVTDWLAKGVVKHHRKLSTILNGLVDAGFRIDHVNEWSPSAEQIARQPALKDELERPMMVLIAARRT
jgi:SAM-dependent methyltransferase